MKKKSLLIILLIALFLGGILVSLTVGTLSVSLSELKDVLLGNGSRSSRLIVFDFRFPRLLVALLAGAALGIAGYLFQAVTHNDLADPGLLGINAGAGFTVLIYLGFFAANKASWLLPLIACLGGGAAAGLVYLCGYRRERLSANRLLLSGIAVNAGISALTLVATIRTSRDSYRFVTAWLSGTIWGTTWEYVFLLLPWLIILLPLLIWRGKVLEVLNLGDEIAIGLGVKLKRAQLFFLICAVCLAAVSVAVAGSISFIGLIAPHVTRNLLGRKSTRSMLFTGFVGGILLLYGDILGRLILPTGEIAAGIVVAVIGAPYFIIQLMRKQ